jgi:hypothetical protein
MKGLQTMKIKIITQENKPIDEPYYSEIVDAVHNGLDTVTLEPYTVNIVSVYTADDMRVIVVEVANV